MVKHYVWLAIHLFLSFCPPTYASLSDAQPVINQFVDALKKEKKIPGSALAVIQGDEMHLVMEGFADRRKKIPVSAVTIFELGSITKAFTGELLALAVKLGKMKLDDTVSIYFPELSESELAHVTMEQLATHTSGLPRMPRKGKLASVTKSDLMEYFKNWKPKALGMHKMQYSNIGYGLLGYCLERAYGADYMTILDDLILKPLDMHSTFMNVPQTYEDRYAQGYNRRGKPANHWPHLAWYAAGALRSSLHDMILFAKANLGVGSVPQHLLDAMHYSHQGFFSNTPRRQVGLGWFRVTRNGVTVVDKNGGVAGFSTYMGMVPDKKLAVIILTNKAKTGITKAGRNLLFTLASSR
jgi:beta-lactamase class C